MFQTPVIALGDDLDFDDAEWGQENIPNLVGKPQQVGGFTKVEVTLFKHDLTWVTTTTLLEAQMEVDAAHACSGMPWQPRQRRRRDGITAPTEHALEQ
jgi:hypothetical protein